MKESVRRSVYLIGAGIWSTGVLWLLFHHFFQRQSEFGPAPHPLEHWWLTLHGAFGFASLWLLGLLSEEHMLRHWRTRRHRKTGASLLAVFSVLVITGFLLYYIGDDTARELLGQMHWVTGIAVLLPFALHRYVRDK